MEFKNVLSSDCPDINVQDIIEDKIFFRVTKNSPPNDGDFIPVWFLRKNKKNLDECISKGLSISEKIEDAQVLIESIPNLGEYIYSGKVICQEEGIVKKTPSRRNPSHRTWYPLVNTDEKIIFNEFKVKVEL